MKDRDSERYFRLTCDRDDTRLDVFLAERLSITRSKIKAMIDGGHVRVSKKIPKPSMKLKRKMVVNGEIPEERPLDLAPQSIPLTILYEDDYLLAINKQAGMVIHPSFGHREGTLVNAVLAYLGQWDESAAWESVPRSPGFKEREDRDSLDSPVKTQNPSLSHVRPGIVHRLDKGTTGVILVAKDGRTQELLSALFKGRAVTKVYRAIAEGVIKEGGGTVEGNIGRHPVHRKKMAVLREGGRESITNYKVISRLNDFTYVETYPVTGRTHQVRVHLAHLGYPIVGDEMYGWKAKGLAGRPLLHAFRISFEHPVTAATVAVEAPIPADMEEFLREKRGQDNTIFTGRQ